MEKISKLKEYTTRDGRDTLIYEIFGDDLPYVHGAYRDKDKGWVPTSWTIYGIHVLSGDLNMNLRSVLGAEDDNVVYLDEFISHQDSQNKRFEDIDKEVVDLRERFNTMTYSIVANGKDIARHESGIVNLINITDKAFKTQLIIAGLWLVGIVGLLIAISLLNK